jgi:O-antigen/teichoic acid export membrane protein
MITQGDVNVRREPRSVKHSIGSLTVVLAANTLIPLITLPYVTRTLGAATFGEIAYVQAFMAFVMLFTDYAFSWSAVRDVAATRDHKRHLSETFCSVWGAQWLLTIIAALALLILAYFVGLNRDKWSLYLWGFMAVVLGNTIFPLWFLQGLERMGEIALIQVCTRLLSIPAIFMLVKTQDDAATVLGIQAGVALLAGGATLLYLWRSKWVDLHVPTFSSVVAALKSGFTLFLSKVGISLYTTLAPLALGLMAGTTAVSYFSLADRIRAAGQSLLTPIAGVMFPRLSHLFQADREGANRLLARGFALTLIISTLICVALICLAGPAIKLLGGQEFGPAIEVLRVLAVLPLIVGLSNVFGVQIMLANGRTRPFNLILAIAAILGVTSIWPLTLWLGAIGAALSIVGVELFVTCAMALYLHRQPHLWKQLKVKT